MVIGAGGSRAGNVRRALGAYANRRAIGRARKTTARTARANGETN
jgi:hypothetical protein